MEKTLDITNMKPKVVRALCFGAFNELAGLIRNEDGSEYNLVEAYPHSSPSDWLKKLDGLLAVAKKDSVGMFFRSSGLTVTVGDGTMFLGGTKHRVLGILKVALALLETPAEGEDFDRGFDLVMYETEKLEAYARCLGALLDKQHHKSGDMFTGDML